MRAEDIMTRDPMYAAETASMAEALTMLSESGIRHLPVVRDGELLGIVSDRDFQGLGLSMVNDVRSYDAMRQRMERSVGELVSGSALSVESDTELAEVIDLFLEEKIGALPVVKKGRLVGIITATDILLAFARLSRDSESADRSPT